MFNESYNNSLEMFGGLHVLTLFFLLIVTIAVYQFRNVISKPKNQKIFLISLGLFLLVFESGFHLWTFFMNEYSYTMIPLTGFCAMTNLLTIFALLANKKRMFNIIVYYAFTGSLFALLFVDTTYGIPHFRYFHYFIVHYGFLLASLYFLFTKQLAITRKNLNLSTLILVVYTFVVFIFNLILKENWFYLFESPVKEISDFFGLPLYSVLWVITIFLLMNIWYYMITSICKFKLHKKGTIHS